MIRILFTGGGTGGHIYPILAVTKELQLRYPGDRTMLNLHYFGAPGPYRHLLEANGIKVTKILSSKLRRYFDLRNLLDIIKFPLSIIQALWKVFWLMPDVLFSKGGPGALAIVLACKFYRIPIMIHESDAFPGLSNRISSRYVKRIGISFASTAEFLPRAPDKIALVGNPIRHSLISGEVLDQATAKKLFGFNPAAPLILIIGGSQGAVRLNDFILDIIKELVKDYQILHQTGIKNFEQVKQEFNSIAKSLTDTEKSRYKIVPYFEKDLKDAYLAADLIISRAGSGLIFEIAALAKPAILIPLPEAAANHQTKNAYEYARSGAAIVIEQDNLKPNIFLTQLRKLINAPERLRAMSEAAKKFAKPEAARVIAEEILKLTARRQ